MSYARNSEVKAVEMLPGVFRKTMSMTDRVMLCEITLKEGAGVPLHQHPHDQIGYVVQGKIRMQIGAESIIFNPGDSYAIPGGTPHSGHPEGGDCTVIDIFHPVREEYR